MSLRIWLPMTKDLRNQGLDEIEVTNNGTTYNATNGKLGGCYYFNGSSKMFLPSFSTTRSIAFWLKCPKTNTTIAFVDFQSKLAFGFQSNGYIIPNNGTSGVDKVLKMYSSENFIANEWNHIALVRDDNLTDVELYINGNLQVSRIDTTNRWDNNYDGCYIGGRAVGTHMTCYMNDFRVYDHALSPMEVKRLSQGLILHYPLSNNGWGQENLASQYIMPGVNNPGITTTTRGRTNYYGDYGISIPATENADTYFSIWYSEPLESGTTYTLSAEVSGLLSGSYYNFPLFAQNNTSMGIIKFDHNGLNTLTFTMNYTDTIATATYNGKTYYHMFMDDVDRAIASGQGAITIKNIKLEKGSIATPWCPNKNDTLYTSLGYNDGIEYDTSGFGNNGTRVGDFSWSTDTPRYLVSTEFSGNSTCVRTSDNNWIARPIEEFTVNLWAYKDDWSTYGGQRLFSCTEGAGFNTEQISQSISFPINVYTSEARTSRQYTDSAYRPLIPLSSITSGWHMFTFTYSTSKISSYLDGELVDSKNYTSYGAFCGDNIPLCIGAEATSNFGTAGGHFVGKISDFKLFYTELDSTDILSLYQASAYIDSQDNIYASSYVEG